MAQQGHTFEAQITKTVRLNYLLFLPKLPKGYRANSEEKWPLILFLHGSGEMGDDLELVPLEESERMVNALKTCGGNVQFTVYPDAGHDSWTQTYNNPELYEWFLKHKRTGK